MVEPSTEEEPFVVNESDSKENSNTHVQSSEKIRSLRAAIDAKLHEQGIYEQIRDLVHLKSTTAVTTKGSGDGEQHNSDEHSEGDNDGVHSTEDSLIRDVLESEVVQQLLAAVRAMEISAPDRVIGNSSNFETDNDGDTGEVENERDVFLYLRLSGGKAFVDQLVELEQGGGNGEDEVDAGWDEMKCPVGSVLTFFRVNATFQQQRLASHDVRTCVDPPFDEHFRFRVEKKRARAARTRGGLAYAVDVTSPWEALCLVEEPVQLDLLKVTKRLLAGIARDVRSFLSKEALQRNASNHSFYKYAKQWWEEYRSETCEVQRLSPKGLGKPGSGEDEYSKLLAQIGSRQRLVKMFAEDEEGRPTDVLLWEAVTGEKFALNDPRAPRRRGYCAIDCVFNHRQFFANVQSRALKLAETSFDFDDESAWKRMDERLIADLPFHQPPVVLAAPDLVSAPAKELEWSMALKRAISSRRRADGLVTRWSDQLSFYLLPALNAYEFERLYGVTQVDNNFFQQSVTNFVQEGHTFQGVPLTFTDECPDEALDAMASNPLVVDILALHARSASFGLAVRCFPYTEHTCATWVMLAVSYQSPNQNQNSRTFQ
ncbi:hypothetical protein BBJ29_003739 [Phytophthora kernoviae]|uniref:Uncharacterized protein n=1 Tax=Phytophthora kernoviae TaxID=325452 RepID=A0A3F2RMM5_9STRA|nr:hypothetical protein BBP00_00006601 [Phytophthora kernoviae]RLN71778.1 hypothetical protein BBJ29_003739 [Phytophthora kernoviae]